MKNIFDNFTAMETDRLTLPFKKSTLLAVGPVTSTLETLQLDGVLARVLADSAVVRNKVNAPTLGEGAPGIRNGSAEASRNNVGDMSLEMLVCAVYGVKLDGRIHEELEGGIEKGSALMDSVEEQADRSMGELGVFP